jgi:MFS family permease
MDPLYASDNRPEEETLRRFIYAAGAGLGGLIAGTFYGVAVTALGVVLSGVEWRPLVGISGLVGAIWFGRLGWRKGTQWSPRVWLLPSGEFERLAATVDQEPEDLLSDLATFYGYELVEERQAVIARMSVRQQVDHHRTGMAGRKT